MEEGGGFVTAAADAAAAVGGVCAAGSGGGDADDAILGWIHDAAENQKPAMIPCAVVPHVIAQEVFNQGQFGVPEGEMAHEPLSVGPDVVVFHVFGQHEGQKGWFAWWEGGNAAHDEVAVMPIDSKKN